LRTSFCCDRTARALAIILALGCGTGASPAGRNSDDPESVEILSVLLPVYGQLAREGLSPASSPEGWVEGRPNRDLATDDVCGCHYVPDGRVVNPDQCAPIGIAGSEDLARAGVVRVITYERLRRAAVPGTGSEIARLKAMGVSERFKAETTLRQILRDPHLAIVAPLPVSDRTRYLDIGSVGVERARWKGCDVSIGDKAFTPPRALTGFIARAMLYAAQRYGVVVDYTLGELKRISDGDPPSAWERQRNLGIARTLRQVGGNPVIEASVRPR
jgi:hypothetical protein